jgi:hypothetical protein
VREATPLAFRQEGEGWHLNPRRHRVLRFGAGAVGVLAVVAGMGNLLDGATGAGVGLLVLAAVVLLVAGPVLSPRRTPLPLRHLAAEPGPGMLLPTRSGGGYLGVVGFGALGAFFLGAVTWTGIDALAQGHLSGLVGVGIGLAVGGLFLAGALGTWRARRTADRGILLTPHGIVLRTRVDPLRLAWEDVVDVRDHWARAVRVGPTMPDDLVDNWLSFVVRDATADRLTALSGSASPSVPVGVLGPDPHHVLEICRHYLAHPGERPGLVDASVLARWQR